MSRASAPWLWARSTVRGHLRSTIFLAVFAGIAGGVVLTGVEVARRTSSAYERYLRYADIADMSVAGCPVGVTQESLAAGFDACFGEENVRAVSRSSRVCPLSVASTMSPSPRSALPIRRCPAVGRVPPLATIDPGHEFSIARPIVVGGRLPRPGAADEVAVNEQLLRSASVHLGDPVSLGTIRASDQARQELNFVPNGPRSSPRIVGVIRLPDDLQPGQSTKGIARLTERDPMVYLPPAWWKAYGQGAAVYFETLAVWAAPGTDADQLQAGIDQGLSDRLHFADHPTADPAPLTRVIDLQSLAAWVIALTTLVAGAAFVGQAIARQLRRELADRATLKALGFDRTHTTLAAISRMAPVAAGCAVIAAVTAVLASPLGPIGLARQAEVDPGIHWDMPVILIGSIAAGLAVVGTSAVSAWRSATARTTSPAESAAWLKAGRICRSPPERVHCCRAPLGPRCGPRRVRRGGRRSRCRRAAAAASPRSRTVRSVTAQHGISMSGHTPVTSRCTKDSSSPSSPFGDRHGRVRSTTATSRATNWRWLHSIHRPIRASLQWSPKVDCPSRTTRSHWAARR